MDKLNQELERLRLAGKLDELSKKFKLEGNEEFMKGDHSGALILYNKAICHAESEENLALAYANRSAAFLILELYDDCLLNIKWARENGYPEEKIQKLNEREEKANKLKEVQVNDPVEDPWNFIKLSHPANPKIPFIVDCLEMKKTEKFGRGIYATRDISTGDILSIEDPVIQCQGNSEESNFYHCYNCVKTCRMNLIPCLKTNRKMFCSEDCRDKTYKKMAGKELLEGVQRKICADIEEKFGDREKLLKFLKTVPDITKLDFSVFDYDWSDSNNLEYGINQAKCAISLKGMHCSRVTTLLNKRGFKFDDCVTKSNKHIEELLTHVFSILFPRKMLQKVQDPTPVVMFANLINYSCIPNVQYILVDNKTILYATQPIKAGEQLFESYGSRLLSPNEDFICHYLQMKTEDRQDVFKSSFNFTCDCRACKEDLNPEKRQIVDMMFAERSMIATKTCEKNLLTNSGKLKTAIDQWKINNDFITKHHENLLAMEVYIVKKLNLGLIEKIADLAKFKF